MVVGQGGGGGVSISGERRGRGGGSISGERPERGGGGGVFFVRGSDVGIGFYRGLTRTVD